MPENILIELKNLNFSYDGITVFKNFNLKIFDSTVFFISGPPGSGKTTLLYIIAGLLKTRAAVYYKNKKASPTYLRNKTSLLLQYPEDQIFEITVLEDIMFPYKINQTKLNENLLYAQMEKINFDKKYLKMKTEELSFGLLRKTALLEVLICGKKILCFDEPLAGLDYKSKLNFIDILKNLKKDGKTIIIASHQIEFFKNIIDCEINLK